MSLQENHVIVVNERDEWLGTMEKLRAHKEGVLHRAFSVFIFNDQDEMLLQQRSAGKYHSPNLWSNTCCSHPKPGESTIAGARRRIEEELGFSCRLSPLFHLRYRSEVGNDLIENEYDHIYVGRYNGLVKPQAEEVKAYRFVPLQELNEWMEAKPQEFTTWFLIAMPELNTHITDFFLKP